MEELLQILLGNDSGISYIAAEILGLIGFIAMAIINYIYRELPELPFSFQKWVNENWAMTLLLFIGMYIGLRWQSDIVAGVNSNITYDFSFIKDKWFWFVLGGFCFRVIIHQANKLVRKITSKD